MIRNEQLEPGDALGVAATVFALAVSTVALLGIIGSIEEVPPLGCVSSDGEIQATISHPLGATVWKEATPASDATGLLLVRGCRLKFSGWCLGAIHRDAKESAVTDSRWLILSDERGLIAGGHTVGTIPRDVEPENCPGHVGPPGPVQFREAWVDAKTERVRLLALWGEEGKSMQTTLSELVVHRAVRDPELLELLSSLSGQIYVEDRTEGVTRNPASFGIAGGGFTRQSRSVSTSESVQRRLMRRLYPDEISFGYGGAHGDPSVVLTLHPTSLGWTRMHPYFSSPLWLRAIIAAMEQLAELPPNPRHLLAPPELEQHGVSDHLVAANDDWTLVERYRSARAALEARALEYRRANGDDHSGPYDGTDPTPPNGGGSDPARPKNSPDDSGAPRDTCSPDKELEAA